MWSFFRARPVTGLCLAGAVVLFALLPSSLAITTRALIAYDAGVIVYILGMGVVMARTDRDALARRAVELDGGRALLLVVTLAAAAASVAAIVAELADAARGGYGAGVIALTVVTIGASWAFMHMMFALHYAHEYYDPDDGDPPGGLQFPGSDDPTYGDFAHFSFVIGCASQTADIAITSRILRRVVTAHCIAAFVFNTAIVALTINIAASLIGGK